MDTLDLHSILEKYNQELFNSLKNDFMNSFKKDLLKDIRTEIYNLFIDNKYTENTTICGFKRTRQRGYCKRVVKGFICPYHLKMLKNNNIISTMPDKKPDEFLYGTYNFSKDISKIKIYDYNKNYLPILKYDKKDDINNIKFYYNEINILHDIEVDPSNNCNIKILDKYENNGYNNLKLKEYIIDPILGSKKKKKKSKVKKIIKINNNIRTEDIKNLIEITLNTFDTKIPKDEIFATLYILLKENVNLFKIYINLILSNINLFFKNVNTDDFSKIWKNNIEYIRYEKVLIYNNDNNTNILEKVFSYVRNNYSVIPQNLKILWVDYNKNNIIMYEKKYFIDNNKSGIKIYKKDDTKKETPLPLDKLTILYY